MQNHGGWEHVKDIINRNFPNGKFLFLDIGGGNGLFADGILECYVDSKGTVIDNSLLLLEKNKPNNRKLLINCGAENLVNVISGKKYDIIFFNWILHHLVTNKYKGTREIIVNCIRDARELLSENGIIIVVENCYVNSVFEFIPSRIIYHALSSKFLKTITRRIGANTAGVGVFYLTENLWCSIFKKVELNVDNIVCIGKLRVGFLYKILCQIRGINIMIFSCSKQ
jgi:hypothetical protein